MQTVAKTILGFPDKNPYTWSQKHSNNKNHLFTQPKPTPMNLEAQPGMC